jgi:hypothetical protein
MAMDEEEEEIEEKKSKVGRSVWTRKEPTSEIMGKFGARRESKKMQLKKPIKKAGRQGKEK